MDIIFTRKCYSLIIKYNLPIKKQVQYFVSSKFMSSSPINAFVPTYKEKIGEPLHVKRARLLYQSRKRGMLENCLLLSNFADKYLQSMSEDQLKLYDYLINSPLNDWDIYYWVLGTQQIPQAYDNEVMALLKEFMKNENKESRIMEPDL